MAISSKQPAPAPLSPAAHHILLALLDGPAHGYALMQRVAEISGGSVRLGPATLYGAIKRLLADGLIEEVDGPADEVTDERRRYYRTTRDGVRVVREELARMERLVRFVRART